MGETKLMGKAFEAELLKRLLQTANCSNNVSIQTVDKNNDQKRRGIVIRSAGSKVSPVFYLDLMYEKYLDGMTLDQIVEDAGDWVKIKYNGTVGYASKKYLELQ